MFLIINTAAAEKVTLILAEGGSLAAKLEMKTAYAHIQSEKLLPAIDGLLKKNKIKLKDLSGIAAVSGPGSFTSLRIGAITANTLAFSLNIPVAGIRISEFKNAKELIGKADKKLSGGAKNKFILPFYGREPNITKKKS